MIILIVKHMKKEKVSIIIPTYKDWDRLYLCLEAVKNQDYGENNFEVIIVNNDPSNSCPYSLPGKNMQLITESKIGSYAARNAGIKIASGKYIGFTDSDCTPAMDWISSAMHEFDMNPNIDRVAGRIIFFKTKSTSKFLYDYRCLFNMDQKHYVENMNGGITANLFVRKDIFNTVGLFNYKLYSGGDNEWGWRAQKYKKKVIYSPNTIIYHPTLDSIKLLLRKKRRTTGGLYNLFYKKLSTSKK